ncbi:MAG: hypothetical protein UV78_C0001G0024 [Parcubacteria group bacterium GW2011_GWA2_43_17]|nr:MAG: hypothetical protein UV78_C0001G0024 [Parcubacteria group bacterium GW2011_GWA2_43_17]OHB44790.1 MAG: hypothetical protein A2Y13_06620 [Planctomycetes bacterium GWC2_45_44]
MNVNDKNTKEQSCLLKDFASPPVEYRPIIFWSWNESMQPNEVAQQLEYMVQGGLGGGFVHSRIGLTTPYLGDDWFKAVQAVVDNSKRLGLKVWLYDEDKWPSGFGGGEVPMADKSFRMKALIARKAGQPSPSNSTAIGPVSHGLQVHSWIAPLDNDWFNGTCYGDLLNHFAMEYFIKISYESYYKRFGKDYGSLILGEFTDEPCALFRGKAPVGAVPYTDELIQRFFEMHGYSPVDKLYMLFADVEGAELFRLQYFRTVNDLFENNFSKQLGDWCDTHRISLTGHYMNEGGVYNQQLWGVKIMPNYRHEGIPGIDHLGLQVTENITAKQCQSVVNQYGKKRMISELYGAAGARLTFADRLWIASQQMCLGVNLLNPHLGLYTMAGCRKRDFPQNMFYQQPWWPLNRCIDEPLARVCSALSKGKYHSEVLVIHPQESAFVLWKSKVQTGSDDIVNCVDFWFDTPTAAGVKDLVTAIDNQLQALLDTLLGSQWMFDLGDETIIEQVGSVVSADGGACLNIKQMNYKAVILPSMITISKKTMDILQEFQKNGGSVFRCGQAPKLLDGKNSPELAGWLNTVESVDMNLLSERLCRCVEPALRLVDFDATASLKVWSHVRQLQDGRRLIHLTNLNRFASAGGRVFFPGLWQLVSLLDMWTGKKKQVACEKTADGLYIDVLLHPIQSFLFLLSDEKSDSEAVSLLPANPQKTIDIPKETCCVERLDDSVFTLDCCYWKESGGKLSSRAMPVIAIQNRLNEMKYNGQLTLRYCFKVSDFDLSRKVRLVVEHPEKYNIRINGLAVKYDGLPFWRDIRWMPIDVTGMLIEGDNVIELYCEQFSYGNLSNVEDQLARYGTEIESIYLVGDFAVTGVISKDKPLMKKWKQFNLPDVKTPCLDEDSLCLSSPAVLSLKDVTVQGLPFYAGRIKISAELPKIAYESGMSVLLEIDRLDTAVAEVRVDDRAVGYFITAPLQVDLSEAIKSGGKKLEIILYSTLRNMLGPHHNIEGEIPFIGPDSFSPMFNSGQNIASSVLDWTENKTKPSNWFDCYCFTSLGEIGNIRLKLVLA